MLTRQLVIGSLLFLSVSIFSSPTSAQDDPAVKANKLLKDHDYDEAVDYLKESLKRSTDTSALYPLLSKAYVGKGDKRASDKKYSDALSEYQSALKYSKDTTAYSGILDSYWNLRKDSALFELSLTLRNSLPNFDEPRGYIAGTYADKGYFFEADGKYSEAILMFEQAIVARGWDTGMMVNEIGDCYEQMKDTIRAITAYKRASTDSNFSIAVATELVAIYQSRNEDDSVYTILQRGTKHEPTYSGFWHTLSRLYERANKQPEALECRKIMARLGDKRQEDSLSHAGIRYDVIDASKFPWLDANFVSGIDSILKRRKNDESAAVEKEPVPTKQVTPDYPDNARSQKLEGTVWVKSLLGRRGDIRKVVIMKSDNTIFNEPSLNAMRQWKFDPALLNGKPVAVWISVPFRFKLNR